MSSSSTSHSDNVALGIGLAPTTSDSHVVNAPLLRPTAAGRSVSTGSAADTLRSDHKHHDDNGKRDSDWYHPESPLGPPRSCRTFARVAVALAIVGFGVAVLAYKLVTSSSPPGPPEQFHIAFTNDTSEIWVTWVRPGGNSPGTPTCHWGETNKTLDSFATGVAVSYRDGNCGQMWCTAWKGWVHSVRLKKLPPGTLVDYVCGDNSNGGLSNKTTFLTPPAAGARDTVTWSTLGDIGSSKNAEAVRNDLLANTPTGDRLRRGDHASHDSPNAPIDFHLQIGDISYSGGVQELWDKYGRLWAPLSETSPMLVSPGNHDGEWLYGNDYDVSGSGGDSGEAYSVRYPGPGPEIVFNSSHTGIMKSTSYWWSINYGPVHIATLSGPHEFAPGSEQYQWLEEDLAKANSPEGRAAQPWIVVTIHYPIYCSVADCFCDYRPNATCVSPQEPRYPDHIDRVTAYFTKSRLEALLVNYSVDLVLTGHEHCYERTLPVKDLQAFNTSAGQGQKGDRFVRPQAPVHVMVGTGGENPDTNWKPKSTWPWIAVRSDSVETDPYPYGWLWSQATKTELHVQFRSLAQHAEYVYDEFWIEK